MTDSILGPPETHRLVRRRIDDVATLYRDAAQALHAFVARLGLGAHDAEDVVAEAFAVLWRMSDERYAQLADPRSYLFVVARHLAYRTSKAATRVVAVDDDLLDQNVVHHDDLMVREEHARLCRVALSTLPPGQQAVLWGSVVEGKSSRSLAAELGTTVTNITTQAQRARRALRQAYLAEFLKQAPRPCEFDAGVLARAILGTASPRQERLLDRHLPECSTCRDAVTEGSDEMRSASVQGTVLVGAVALDWLGRAEPGPPPDPPTLAGRRRRSVMQTALAVTCLVLGLMLPGLSLLAAHQSPPAGMSGARDRDTGTTLANRDAVPRAVTAPGPGVNVSATPAVHDLTMPAPGQSTTWNTQVVNHSALPVAMAIAVEVMDGPRGSRAGTEVPWLHFELDGEPIGPSAPVTAYRGRLVYTGQLPAGATWLVTATAARPATDTDPHLSTRLRVRFVAGLQVADGTQPGTLVEDPERDGTTLADTGTRIPWTAPVACVLLLTSGITLVRLRRRRPPEPRRPPAPASSSHATGGTRTFR